MRMAARKAGKVLAYDFHHRFALDTQLLREAVMKGELGEIYYTTAQALRRCGVPGWGVFTNKTLQGGGPLIDIGIHMLDAAMYVLGFPAVKKVTAHSFQRLGNRKSSGQFGEWDPTQFTVEDALFGTIEFCNGGILRLDTSFALNIREQSIMNVAFCGEKAGAMLFPAHIYNDEAGTLVTLTQREEADDRRHMRSMDAFVRHVQGEPVMIADASRGWLSSSSSPRCMNLQKQGKRDVMLNVSVLTDPDFCPHSLNKYASIMACGNGYMGIRAAHEEDYTQQTRGMYLAGLYHRAGRNETTELINLPDIIGIDVELDSVNFTLLSGEILEWRRELAFANGELRRSVVWRSPDGKRYRLESRRFVSLDQLPLVAMQLSITPLDAAAHAVLQTGIDATQTNSGRQHLDEVSVRVFDQEYMQGVYETQDRASEIVVSAYCQLSAKSDSCFTAKNRRLSAHHSLTIAKGDTVTLEKIVWVAHRSDKALSQASFARNALADLKVCAARGYDALLESSACAWQEVWRNARVEVGLYGTSGSDGAGLRRLAFDDHDASP